MDMSQLNLHVKKFFGNGLKNECQGWQDQIQKRQLTLGCSTREEERKDLGIRTRKKIASHFKRVRRTSEELICKFIACLANS